MGLVLAFQTTPRPAARPAPRRVEPAQSADILFFTGVRYERQSSSQAQRRTSAAERSDPIRGS